MNKKNPPETKKLFNSKLRKCIKDKCFSHTKQKVMKRDNLKVDFLENIIRIFR